MFATSPNISLASSKDWYLLVSKIGNFSWSSSSTPVSMYLLKTKVKNSFCFTWRKAKMVAPGDLFMGQQFIKFLHVSFFILFQKFKSSFMVVLLYMAALVSGVKDLPADLSPKMTYKSAENVCPIWKNLKEPMSIGVMKKNFMLVHQARFYYS